MAAQFPKLQIAGDPARVLMDAIASAAGPSGIIALLSAPGYLEDHQVVSFLAARLRDRGCRALLARPEQVAWRDGIAFSPDSCHAAPLGAIVRFYQAEWLPRLPEKTGWRNLLVGGRTPVTNPAHSVISESKRFPLVWDRLSQSLPTWCALLPETRAPRHAPWACDDSWLLKTSLCNNGDTVSIRELMPKREWLRTQWRVHVSPGDWVAQRRFESLPIPTPSGPRHVCVGLYTVDGEAAGAYARLSQGQLIDYAAIDVPLLLEANE